MPDAPWTRLRAPFPKDAVTWEVAEVAEAGGEAMLLPRLEQAAIAGRLEEVVGTAHWSLRFAPIEGGVVCTLRIGEVTRSAVADLAAPGVRSPERAAEIALARAAALFGMRPPIDARRWLPYDPETGEVLDDGSFEGLDDMPATGPSEELQSAALERSVADAALETEPQAAVALAVGEAQSDLGRAAAEARGVTAEGRRMIDLLIDRLKDEGQGLAAARLLVRYGGYGKDPAAARELYGQLRALLLRVGEGAAAT